ncbi:MAG: ribonuclease PH [Bdellovibrionales bacterium]|nr:ribonuclease PH [Bdellovibrionales bacterium]
MRIDGRGPGDLRPITFRLDVNPYAEGSVEVSFGKTTLLITASVDRDRPKWLAEGAGGWITAEYGMLPRATHTRSGREASIGKQSGRTQEIQRLIGRALRAAVNLREIEGLMIRVDCDVLVADGGTRTAAISGGWLALRQALERAAVEGLLPTPVTVRQIAAVSLGMVQGEPLVDLCYEEDSTADFDLNLVFNDQAHVIEIQGTAERTSLPNEELLRLLTLGESAARHVMALQQAALATRG